MTPQERVLNEAAQWIGTTEDPPGSNRTPFAVYLDTIDDPRIPRNGSAWCSTFQKYVFTRCDAAAALRGAVMFNTPADATVFRKAGHYYADPQVGDLAFYYSTAKKRIAHVGLVESVEKSYVTTIEGNTSSSAVGSQDNGGGVYRRRRLRTWWAGYGRPDWALIPSTPPPPQQEDDIMFRLIRPAGYYDIALLGGVVVADGLTPDIVNDLVDHNYVVGLEKGARNYDEVAVVLRADTWAAIVGRPPVGLRPNGEV